MLLLQLMFIIVLLVWLVRGWRRPANFPPGISLKHWQINNFPVDFAIVIYSLLSILLY